MDKNEIISLIDKLCIDKNEFYIASSSALVIRGLIEKTNLLKLIITEAAFKRIEDEYGLKEEDGLYKLENKVVFSVGNIEYESLDDYDEYHLEKLEDYFEFLKSNKEDFDTEYQTVKPIIEKGEYLDLYDENRNRIGKKILRYKKLKPKKGTYIIITIVFIENSEGKFLIQKTSKEKGSVFATTGGLVKSGSTSQDTIREEIKEELGIELDDLKLVYTQTREYAFQDCYYIKKDIDIDTLTLQKEEVDYVKWLSVDEIEELIKQGQFRLGNIAAFEFIKESTNL